MSCLNKFSGASVLDRHPVGFFQRTLWATPYLPQLLCAIRDQPDGCACITLSVLSIIVLLIVEWRARQGTGTVSSSYLDSREWGGPSIWFVVIVMVYVEWKYFNTPLLKARVVADREMLWWDARQGCMMVAKLSVGSLPQLYHHAWQLRGLWQQSRPCLK